jgi:hypothetical protein
VVPLLEMDRTSLICISTPQSSLNFYSKMFELLSPDGTLLFNCLRVGLACSACLEAGKAASCVHNAADTPPWKSQSKNAMVKMLYDMSNQSELFERESAGVITMDESSVFPMHKIDYMFQNQQELTIKDPRWITCACDPTGGGSSFMSLVSGSVQRGKFFIVGADAARARGSDQIQSLLMQHMMALRRRFPTSLILFFCENNMGQEASHCEFFLRTMGRLHCAREDGYSGVRTTNLRKQVMVGEVQKYMSTDALVIDADMIVANTTDEVDTIKARTLAKLRDELTQFRRTVIVTQRADPRVIYSGKDNNQQDDMAMALMLLVYWTVQFAMGCAPGLPLDLVED